MTPEEMKDFEEAITSFHLNPWLPPSVWIEGPAFSRGLRRDLLCRPRRSPFVVGRDDQALRFWWRISAVMILFALA